jgi:predicted nucleotidyltransferase
MHSELKKICDHAVEVLKNTFGDDFKALALFGSAAREEETEYSDIDLFAIIDNIPQLNWK